MAAPVPYLPATYLQANAAERPDAPAVIGSLRTASFSELYATVTVAARQLTRVVNPIKGSVIAVQLPNIADCVALELAIPLAEGIVLPLPLNLGVAEIRHALEETEARLLVTGGTPENHAAASTARELGIPTAESSDVVHWSAEPSTFPAPPADPSRIVEIALTSGTTGMPKLASLSAGLKQATYEGFTSRLEVGPEDRVLPVSPLMQGIGGMCLLCSRVGAALVMSEERRFDPRRTLNLAARTNATVLVGVPTNVIRLLEALGGDPVDLDRCRTTAVAGAPMPPDVAQAWEARTGSRVVSFYGSMDAGQLAVGRPSDPPEKRWFTVGRPHDTCECLICGEDGRAIALGDIGEICMRGPTVQECYWGAAHGPLSADGWAHMGDLGRLDRDGYLQVVGRLKDIVIRGGTNINPYELEDALRKHPAVRDACVVGKADRVFGERPIAFIVGQMTLGELQAHLDRLGIAKYKWPEFVELVDEIPLSGPGKVNRKLLKERASAESAVP